MPAVVSNGKQQSIVEPDFMPAVDSDVPIPKARSSRRAYPFDRMGIGDSFFVALPTNNVTNIANYHRKRNGGRYTCRSVVENGVKGTRCWRTA